MSKEIPKESSLTIEKRKDTLDYEETSLISLLKMDFSNIKDYESKVGSPSS